MVYHSVTAVVAIDLVTDHQVSLRDLLTEARGYGPGRFSFKMADVFHAKVMVYGR